MKKGIIIILDGLGDRPSSVLAGRTALEAANTPFMDGLLSKGCCGLVDPLSPGVPVDTHTGCGALMGVVPEDLRQLSRGPVEAAGIGLNVKSGDILVRSNFATLGRDETEILDRRAGRISEGVAELCLALENIELHNGVIASLYPASHHRAVLRLRGTGLSSAISDTDPGTTGMSAGVLRSHAFEPTDQHAVNTAAVLNEFSQRAQKTLELHPLNLERISKHRLPANGLLFRGAGMAYAVRSLISRLRLKAAVVTGEKTLNGLGRLLNFSVIQQSGFTGMADTDLDGKFSIAKQLLADHDLVYVHIKATDIFSHSKDPQGKAAFLERIDKAMNAYSDIDCVIGISADHSTNSSTGNHCGDPVPGLIYASGGRVDGETSFSERACARGGLGRINGHGFLLTVLDAMGRVPNYHPFDAAYFSGV